MTCLSSIWTSGHLLIIDFAHHDYILEQCASQSQFWEREGSGRPVSSRSPLSEMRIGSASEPSSHSSAVMAGVSPTVSGYRSSWNNSDCPTARDGSHRLLVSGGRATQTARRRGTGHTDCWSAGDGSHRLLVGGDQQSVWPVPRVRHHLVWVGGLSLFQRFQFSRLSCVMGNRIVSNSCI